MALLGMGNPLLDISAVVPDEELTKWGVKPGDIQLVLPDSPFPPEKYDGMYDQLVADYTDKIQYIPGGATQNSIRVAQWLLQTPGQTRYVGCIGKDAFGEIMKKSLADAGVGAFYMEDPDTPTGKCAALINGADRALVTNLQAANNYKVDHLKANTTLLDEAQIVYSAGFFLTVSVDSMLMAADAMAADPAKKYCMNLSAPFLMEVPPLFACMQQVLPKADVVFGNETEAATFAKVSGWETTDNQEIAKMIQALPKESASKPRMVVITQGADPTIVATGTEVVTFPVIKCDSIVDVNGAGDSFVAGFLAGMLQGLPIAECARAGNYAANVVIQRSGCTLPDAPDFTFAK